MGRPLDPKTHTATAYLAKRPESKTAGCIAKLSLYSAAVAGGKVLNQQTYVERSLIAQLNWIAAIYSIYLFTCHEKVKGQY